MESQRRDVFYVSDGTAITCETLGHVVLGQFAVQPNEKTFPFVESDEKLSELLKQIQRSYQLHGGKTFGVFLHGDPRNAYPFAASARAFLRCVGEHSAAGEPGY